MKQEINSSNFFAMDGSSAEHLCAYIIEHHAQALHTCASLLPTTIKDLITLIEKCTGRIIFSGIGKSGIIARKCSATFSSLGMPSFFLHPLDSLHGDIGALLPNDLYIIFSKSGEGEEFKKIIPYLKQHAIESILISCKKGTLTKFVEQSLIIPFEGELPLFPHVPSASSSVMMSVGDALALTLALRKGFSSADFALRHPAGALGNSLLLTVDVLMYTKEQLPFLHKDDLFQKIITEISLKNLGVGIVLHNDTSLAGIITDGDLRRACSYGEIVFSKKAAEIMSAHPCCISSNTKALAALKIMKERSITSLIVIDSLQIIGLVRMHEIINAGITL